MELLQLLKAHLDYKERTQMLASCDVMTESTITVSSRCGLIIMLQVIIVQFDG